MPRSRRIGMLLPPANQRFFSFSGRGRQSYINLSVICPFRFQVGYKNFHRLNYIWAGALSKSYRIQMNILKPFYMLVSREKVRGKLNSKIMLFPFTQLPEAATRFRPTCVLLDFLCLWHGIGHFKKQPKS